VSKIREFYLLTEEFLKHEVVFAQAEELEPESFDRLIEKLTILLSRKTHPKQVYKLTKQEVRDTIREVYHKLATPSIVTLSKYPAFGYLNPIGKPRKVFARTKKEAREILKSFHFSGNSIGKLATLKKVTKLSPDRYETETGETFEFIPWLHTVNIHEAGDRDE